MWARLIEKTFARGCLREDRILYMNGTCISIISWRCVKGAMETYRQRSSTTLMTFRIPRWCSLGAGAPASEPSPRKTVPSSVLCLEIHVSINASRWNHSKKAWEAYICAASRMVKGRTRTATVMDDCPFWAIVVGWQLWLSSFDCR